MVNNREILPCKFHMKTAEDIFKSERLEWDLEDVKEVKSLKSNPERYAGVYGELAEILSDAQVLKIWKRFSGVNVTFPQRLYSKEYTSSYIKEHRADMTAGEIAKELGLSERRVRQIISEIREEENEK